MKRAFKTFLALMILSAASISDAKEFRWKDADTETQFLFLPGAVDWRGAYKKCHERGWDMFNLDYLKPEEQERFLASATLDNLPWQTHFKGEPAEHGEVSVWMSSQSTAITWNQGEGASTYLHLKKFRSEKSLRTRTRSDGKDSKSHHTMCMYQSHTWEGCAHELHCTYEQSSGSTLTIRYSLYEYGPHRSVALQRIRDRVKNWPGGIGAKCEIPPRDPFCVPYR